MLGMRPLQILGKVNHQCLLQSFWWLQVCQSPPELRIDSCLTVLRKTFLWDLLMMTRCVFRVACSIFWSNFTKKKPKSSLERMVIEKIIQEKFDKFQL